MGLQGGHSGTAMGMCNGDTTGCNGDAKRLQGGYKRKGRGYAKETQQGYKKEAIRLQKWYNGVAMGM